MEKKYRLKEEWKKLVVVEYRQAIMTLHEWNDKNITNYALEEVEQRTKIKSIDFGENKVYTKLKPQEIIDICEKAINGELITKEQAIEFASWFSEDSIAIEANLETYLKIE